MGVKHLYILIASTVIITFGFFLSSPFSNALAQIGSFGTPFGGRVLFEIPCDCNTDFGTLLIVGPPVGGEYILSPFSTVYKNYSPFPPNWVLGLAEGFELCLVGVPPFCTPAGGGPIIKIIGTS